MRLRRWTRVWVVLALVGTGLVTLPARAGAPQQLAVQVVSNRADLVSGGDALVQVDLPAGARAATVAVNGRDVSSAFALRANGRFQGLVTGLRTGPNDVVARSGRKAVRLTVTNHAIGGSIFSGPQLQPFFCSPGALDAQCNRPTTYDYLYKSSVTGSFAAYDPTEPPPDVATTTTDEGKTVPYVVRRELGSMDRGQYAIAVLHDGTERFTRWTGPAAWNHKVFMWFGAGCAMRHVEGVAPDVMQDTMLAKGFAVLSTALSDNTWSCNLSVQAESVMMAKEHLVEAYGDVRYTFGHGCSGGSIAQLHMANAYPGLLDGISVYCTMPDVPVLDLLDCTTALRYFNDPRLWQPGVVWPEHQQAAALGMASTSVCHTWVEAYRYPEMFNPRTGAGCDLPERAPEVVYHPETNPTGIRCSLQDYLGNIFGPRPKAFWEAVERKIGRGFAGRPYDNVGVQYGLRALLAGTISPSQFVDLNTKVGAVGIDWDKQDRRVATDIATLETAYRSGVVNEGTHLDRVAILDTPGYFPGDRYEIHDNTKSWALRARLDAANGHHDNQVLWYGLEGRFQDVYGTMDRWLANVEKDRRDIPLEKKVVAARPPEARDQCSFPDQGTVCDALFGPSGNPRWGAGGSLAQDVIKCRLTPLSRSSYGTAVFTDEQWAALQAAFPGGVCDWSKKGVGQQPTIAWQTYAGGPGGRPLGPAPRSVPVRG